MVATGVAAQYTATKVRVTLGADKNYDTQAASMHCGARM